MGAHHRDGGEGGAAGTGPVGYGQTRGPELIPREEARTATLALLAIALLTGFGGAALAFGISGAIGLGLGGGLYLAFVAGLNGSALGLAAWLGAFLLTLPTRARRGAGTNATFAAIGSAVGLIAALLISGLVTPTGYGPAAIGFLAALGLLGALFAWTATTLVLARLRRRRYDPPPTQDPEGSG